MCYEKKHRTHPQPRPLTEVLKLPDQAFLTPHETSALMVMTVNSLRVRRSMGTGPKFMKNGHTIRYRKADVLAWLDGESNAVEAA
ncbi:MAG: DNA-binding protein [Gammaproteobacteria bacterium]|nr:MAG: DNA-binding protein [Gammaproteobacteria bacterium]